MLTEQEVRALISRPESEVVERKENPPNRHDLRKTLVAFANSVPDGQHAVLFLGITDRGEVRGLTDTDGAQKAVREAAQDCFPEVKYSTTLLSVETHNVLAIIIEASKERPHFTGQAYVRKGSQSVQASKDRFEEMIAARNDKARVLLRHRGELVSIEETEPEERQSSDPNDDLAWQNLAVRNRDYRIEECDAHCVELRDMNFNFRHVLPLTRIHITRSIVPSRLKLVIEGKLHSGAGTPGRS